MSKEFDKRNTHENETTGSAPDDATREEVLGSLLDNTNRELAESGVFPLLVEHVRAQRLPSSFSFENLSELVRFIVGRTRLAELTLDQEDCISWISNCIYDDPIAHQRTENLWLAIVSRIQNGS